MADTKLTYDVAVEEGGLNWEKAGPLFDRYAVNLAGRIDRRWVDCYQRLAASTPSFSRFRLEAAAGSVTFTCRATDGPVEVMGVLKRLEELLQRVNREATAGAAARPAEGAGAGRVPAAPPPGSTPERAGGLAAGLLARLTKS